MLKWCIFRSLLLHIFSIYLFIFSHFISTYVFSLILFIFSQLIYIINLILNVSTLILYSVNSLYIQSHLTCVHSHLICLGYAYKSTFKQMKTVADSYNCNNLDHNQDQGIFAFSTIHLYFFSNNTVNILYLTFSNKLIHVPFWEKIKCLLYRKFVSKK